MALIPGARLGPYEIIAQIGAGGMGEVYRARDTKLRRDVAIKILPDVFASDTERVARFSREAQTLAALNHPHIAQIYGIEETDHARALVMELVDGEDLAQRLARGPIPVDEALPIARQIAEALEAAHEQGIIHRDLKPANIKIRPDGTVKVLDFGLAKPLGAHPVSIPSGALTNSPTITSPIEVSGAGVLLGTAAYMAPEQAKGRAVDKRADIWALGCVLFEMLTGRRAFAGDGATDTIAQVLMKEPDWSLLPAGVPSPVRKLLRRCLEKDRQRRLDSAADARLEIDDAIGGTPEWQPVVTPSKSAAPRKWFGWSVTALAVVAASIFAMSYFRAPPRLPEMRLDVAIPDASALREFALSPDGQRLVAAVFAGGQRQLWVRSLKSSTWQPLKGTEGAQEPFWSPESRSIGFFASNKLKRIDIDGAALQTLADARPVGGTWNQNNIIVFAMSTFGSLARISASGGEPVVITKIEGQQTAHLYPLFLPDGHHFLFFSRGIPSVQGIYLASLESAETKMLVPADEGTAGYLPPGWLLFVSQGILRAQRLDVQKLELSSDVLAVASSVANSISVSTTGLIGYRATSTRHTQLVWTDRTGKTLGSFGPQNDRLLSAPTLSPDEGRVAMYLAGDNSGDVVLIDSARITRFTFEPAADRFPIWSPDSHTIVFDSARQKSRDLYRSNNSGGEERLLATPQAKTANDWSFDGRFILFQSNDPKTGIDLWVLPLEGKREPYVFLRTPFNERRATFSPDGRWVAYLSNESGRYEVYVRAFFEPNRSESFAGTSASSSQVSNNGGIQPCWSADGKELYYIGPDGRMMAVTIKVTGSRAEPAAPVALFSPHILGVDSVDSGLQFDVARDGRFLLNTLSDDTSPITVIVNWSPEISN